MQFRPPPLFGDFKLGTKAPLASCLFQVAKDSSYFALSSIGKNVGRNHGIRSSRCDVLAGEISQEGSIGLTTESPRASKPVQLANTAEVCAAVLIGSRIRAGEQLTIDRSLYNSRDVLENIALRQNKTASTNFKGMPVSVAVIPVIVHLIRVSHGRDIDTRES